MDMQSMPMQDMANEHNTFWRENQVIVTFHSNILLTSADGINYGATILKELNLEAQLHSLNQFLEDKKINYTLSFFEEEVKPQESHPTQESSSSFEQKVRFFNPPPGVYLFGLSKPIQSDFGEVNTSIVTFFKFRKDTSSSSMADTASEADARSGIEKGDNDDDDKDHHSGEESVPVVKIVNQINTGLGELHNRQVPISAASPVFLCGGTPSNSQGCPLTPPIPVEDDCAFWRFKLPKLTPDDLQKVTGVGVTVFILDTLPERKVISSAAEEAGDDNLLLLDVNNSVTFNYNVQTQVIMDPDSKPVVVGKDVYGQHFGTTMPDHGLFIAGIVRDLTPNARVECIRILNDYCVGDTNMLTQALQYIHDRMSLGGDLYQKPVVINMSLVIPTKEEAKSMGIDPDLGNPNNDMLTSIRQQIQSLVGLGAIFVASAGNEGDLRENPSSNRPAALYPAAFANPPDSIDGIIPVGAINSKGKVTSYSCYPGPRGIATYGGEVPEVTPKDPDPNNPPIVTVSEAVRGIYSSDDYPPLSVDPLTSEYKALNAHAWANWVGTSFATPIISAVAARVLELKLKGVPIPNVHDAIIAAAGTDMTKWDRLDPATPGSSGGSAVGPVILAVQQCQIVDEDEEALTMNYQFIRDKSSRVVKDVMDPAVRIEPGITKGDARQTLMQQNVPFGVLSNTEGKQFTIVTMDQLSAPNLDEQVQVFAVDKPSFYVTIDPHDNLDNIVQTWATDFAANQDLIGMVVQEQNEILGILPREKIEEHARRRGLGGFGSPQGDAYPGYPVGLLEGASVSRLVGDAYPGYPVGRLAGDPFSGAVFYTCPDCPRGQECPDGPEERPMWYYDPNNPPVCKWHQHPMLRKS